jgi:uncharacterized protein YjbI with pentapeptide repeats
VKRKTTWDDRWDQPRVEAVVRALNGLIPVERAAFPPVDGRFDLRGLPLDQEWLRGSFQLQPPGTLMQSGWAPLAFERPAWHSLDLSHARISQAEWSNGTLANCRFGAAQMPMGFFRGVDATGCSFRGANMYNSSIHGYYKARFRASRHNTFTDCDFSSADLRWSYAGGQFMRCDFSRAKFNGDWWHSANFASFRQCIFAGRLSSPMFSAHSRGTNDNDPARLDGTDFSNAELVWPSFRGLNLRGVKWPDDDKHVIVRLPRSTLPLAEMALEQAATAVARTLLGQVRRVREELGPDQDSMIFHHTEFTQYAGQDGLPLARQVLSEAERQAGVKEDG